jgi:hypothetical protein
MGVGQKPKKKTVPATRSTLPSMKAIVDAGNRASAADTKDLKAVQKYANGGKVQTSSDPARKKEADRKAAEIARNIARKKDADRKAAEIKARGPNNAYGTMEARDRVLRKVQNDIEARDRADEDAVKRKPVGVDFIGGEPATYRKMSKMEKMAYDDQAKRSGYNEEGSFGRKHLVSGVKETEVFPNARKRGIKPADVMKKGGKVQKMAKGGKVTRADGIARKGKTKGKMV